jgi:hypothetical protein
VRLRVVDILGRENHNLLEKEFESWHISWWVAGWSAASGRSCSPYCNFVSAFLSTYLQPAIICSNRAESLEMSVRIAGLCARLFSFFFCLLEGKGRVGWGVGQGVGVHEIKLVLTFDKRVPSFFPFNSSFDELGSVTGRCTLDWII